MEGGQGGEGQGGGEGKKVQCKKVQWDIVLGGSSMWGRGGEGGRGGGGGGRGEGG